VGATEWPEMGGEKKPLVMSELGCADGCGREMGAENCADGCGRRVCQGMAGNGWGEEAAGDQQAWLRGRLRTGNGCGELRVRLRTACWKMRMRVDHGHMQFKIVTNRDELCFLPLKIMTICRKYRDKP